MRCSLSSAAPPIEKVEDALDSIKFAVDSEAEITDKERMAEELRLRQIRWTMGFFASACDTTGVSVFRTCAPPLA